MSAPRFVLAGGGTGGHLFPGLAVADAICGRESGADIVFFTTTRALDRQLLAGTPYQQIEQPVLPFTLHPLRMVGFWLSWRQSVRRARAELLKCRPRAVLGLGGYAAGPPVVAAHALGIRTAILNPDAIPGRANRHLARHADLVVLQWEASAAHFPAGTNCEALGCPIRADFAVASAAAGRQRFGLDPVRPLVLVTGASQGAHTVNQAVMQVWPAFHGAHPEWQLLHLTGPADEADVRAAYARAGSAAQVLAFTPAMASALAAADLVISRAGASTLAELTALHKPSILLPYPYHRDRHQHANAGILTDVGAAVLLEDRLTPQRNAPQLRDALERVTEPTVLRGMAQAAARLARPDAAVQVAAWLWRC